MYSPRQAIHSHAGSPIPWSWLPGAWLEPARSGSDLPWRAEWRLAPRPLTPYSAAVLAQVLPRLAARISRELALPSAGVELDVRQGYVFARPLPLRGPGRWLPLRAALHGLRAGRLGWDLLRWWDGQGARALLADIGELRLRVAPLDRRQAEPREWTRVLERCLEVWSQHLDRVLRAEALAALGRLQLQALLEVFGVTEGAGGPPDRPVTADDLLPVPAVEAEIDQRLWHMATLARKDRALHQAFTETRNGQHEADGEGEDEAAGQAAPSPAGEMHRRLSRLAADSGRLGGSAREFFALWNQFLERFGHLAWPPAELAAPTWAEEPATALQILAAHVAQGGPSPVAEEVNAGRRRQEILATIEARLGHRRVDRYRLEETRRLAEAMRRVASELGYHLLLARFWWRRAVLLAGRELAARGCLAAAEDVWFLTPDEVLDATAATDSGHPPDLLTAAAGRRRQWEQALRGSPPWLEGAGSRPET
ncbi:MAG TPA: hypothetical protein VIK99_04620 [Thermaerobacter sp.]